MLGCWGWTAVSRDVVEDRSQLIEGADALCKNSSFSQRDPSPCERPSVGTKLKGNGPLLTLVFPVAALYLLMQTLLDLSFQHPCPGRLVVACNFKNVGGIYVLVFSPSHNMTSIDIEFEHRNLQSVRRLLSDHDRKQGMG